MSQTDQDRIVVKQPLEIVGMVWFAAMAAFVGWFWLQFVTSGFRKNFFEVIAATWRNNSLGVALIVLFVLLLIPAVYVILPLVLATGRTAVIDPAAGTVRVWYGIVFRIVPLTCQLRRVRKVVILRRRGRGGYCWSLQLFDGRRKLITLVSHRARACAQETAHMLGKRLNLPVEEHGVAPR